MKVSLALTIVLLSAVPAFASGADSQLVPDMSTPFARPAEAQEKMDAAMGIIEGIQADAAGDYTGAKAAYQKALSAYDSMLLRDPENLEALNGRALVRDKLGQPGAVIDAERVIEIATRKLQSEPNNAELYQARATAYRTMERYDDATQDYEKAIALSPEPSQWELDLRTMQEERRLQGVMPQ